MSEIIRYKRIRIDKDDIDRHLGYEISEEVFDELIIGYYPCDHGDFIEWWLEHIDDEVIESIKEEIEE